VLFLFVFLFFVEETKDMSHHRHFLKMKTIQLLFAAALAVAGQARSTLLPGPTHQAGLSKIPNTHVAYAAGAGAIKLNANANALLVPRGGGDITPETATSIATLVVDALQGLSEYLKGTKSDTLLLLFTTALNTPICKNLLKISPILGYLILGVVCGPNGYGLINDVHKTELLGELGIVFFLFEMGIHLDFSTLMAMRKDVFGLGGSQFLVTALAVALIVAKCGLGIASQIVLGGGLALSSSAFVLQLLKDKEELQSQFGRSSFGVLLLQDLAVVPLLVVTPILAGTGQGLGVALGSAAIKASMAIGTIGLVGKFLLTPFFKMVVAANNQEALVGAILTTVLGMSFLTEGLGLSNTLGAFLAGVLLSETPWRHRIEKEIAPFRGILVGLFFFTVGFEIDLQLIATKWGLVGSIVFGIVALKAIITTGLCLAFGLNKSISQRVGLILSQGGEFAFVAFRLARSYDILDNDLTKLMLTCVSLTMGLTPFLEEFGSRMATKLDLAEANNQHQSKKKMKKQR
jgi:CPA2 family monovalent cation:H+ antiporter-2